MKRHRWIALASTVVLAFGCGKSEDASPGAAKPGSGEAKPAAATVATSADPQSATNLEGPARAVYEWLDAVRTGNDAKATAMLTQVARQKAIEQDRTVRPPASDTARFQVGAVQYIGEDGARVASLWTDVDEDGETQTDEAMWVLRKEPEGWRVGGVAATVFEGEPPLLLNFEDPEETVQKQQWLREEVERRKNAPVQARAGEGGEEPVRR